MFLSPGSSIDTLNAFLVLCLDTRVRFLFGGRHGEFRFLPPPGFVPCSEALLPKVKLKIEPCQKYILDHGEGKQELTGPLVPLTPVTFTPTPVDISKVNLLFFFFQLVRFKLLCILFIQFKVSVLHCYHTLIGGTAPATWGHQRKNGAEYPWTVGNGQDWSWMDIWICKKIKKKPPIIKQLILLTS